MCPFNIGLKCSSGACLKWIMLLWCFLKSSPRFRFQMNNSPKGPEVANMVSSMLKKNLYVANTQSSSTMQRLTHSRSEAKQLLLKLYLSVVNRSNQIYLSFFQDSRYIDRFSAWICITGGIPFKKARWKLKIFLYKLHLIYKRQKDIILLLLALSFISNSDILTLLRGLILDKSAKPLISLKKWLFIKCSRLFKKHF